MSNFLHKSWTSRLLRKPGQTVPSLCSRTALLKRRCYTSDSGPQDVDELTKWTRNIGIIAHIDAGKTTTTERMLYYSGYTRRIGDVDDGSTVTDFLPAERARGITIQSAAITFHWPPLPASGDQGGGLKTIAKGQPNPGSHTINLIDTPGHADFTFEVLRSLRILDGAVCILDGVAGVEAQTEKVWHQAKTYNIPKIIYINKLDRDGAAFGRTVKEIAAKLHAYPAVCQIPWFENGNGAFCGVVDVVNLRAMKWEAGDGKKIAVQTLDQLQQGEPKLAKEARKARTALVEMLSEHDDQMVDSFLDADEDHMAVKPAEVLSSLHRVLRNSSPVVPVFAGASFRNIGVQPVIDAVTELLPNPAETPDPQIRAGPVTGGLAELVAGKVALNQNTEVVSKKIAKKAVQAQPQKLETCALAFKVVNDARRGVLVYVRVYQGSLNKNSLLFNTNLQVMERSQRLLRMYANDAVEIESIPAGQIGVIPGLKHARTGDTLITYTGMNPKNGPPAPLNELQLRPIDVPPPVFFASVEPNSLGEQKSVEEALSILLREDPSLQLSIDEESGQTHLSGMGELHLEIARDRLINDMKAKCSVGKIEIGFRECISADGNADNVLFDREIAGRAGKASCSAQVKQTTEEEFVSEGSHIATVSRDGNSVSVEIVQSEEEHPESTSSGLPANLTPTMVRHALQNGASAALARGPQHSFSIHGVHVNLRFDPVHNSFGTETTVAALSSAARLATQTALRKSHSQQPTHLMEPVMNVLISVDEASLGGVVHDLTSARGGQVVSLEDVDVLQTETSGSQTREDVPSIDMKRVYAPPDPWESGQDVEFTHLSGGQAGNRPRTITAKVPLKEMVGYLKYLRSLTGGRGNFVMSVDKFERMGTNREKAVLRELNGM